MRGQPAWRVRPQRLTDLLAERRSSRDRRTWSNTALGETLGVSGETIRKIANGQTAQPNPQILAGLADLLDVPVTEIIDGHLPSHAGLEWINTSVLDGLRRLQDPASQAAMNEALERLLWLYARPSPQTRPDPTATTPAHLDPNMRSGTTPPAGNTQ